MQRPSPLLAAGLIALCTVCGPAGAQSVPARAPTDAARGVLSYAEQVEPAMSSVVGIAVTGSHSTPTTPEMERFFGRLPPRESSNRGSGFVIDGAEGLIVTANFLLENATTVRVRLPDEREVNATIVARDEVSDIALLRIEATNLRPLSWADSGTVRIGDVAFAIGYAGKLGKSTTSGIISGFTPGDADSEYREFILTDTAFPFGYAGGPLLDSRGRVIGIGTAIYSHPQFPPISCAIPAAEAQRVIKDLRAFGRVKRGRLGINVSDDAVDQDPSDGLQVFRPATVDNVVPGSPAERAGLRVGDAIVRAAGKPIRSASELIALVRKMGVGATLDIVYQRGGAEHSVSVVLDEPSP